MALNCPYRRLLSLLDRSHLQWRRFEGSRPAFRAGTWVTRHNSGLEPEQ